MKVEKYLHLIFLYWFNC